MLDEFDQERFSCPQCGEESDSYEVFVEWRGACPHCGERVDDEEGRG